MLTTNLQCYRCHIDKGGSITALRFSISRSLPTIVTLWPQRELHNVSYLVREAYSSSIYKSMTTRYTTTINTTSVIQQNFLTSTHNLQLKFLYQTFTKDPLIFPHTLPTMALPQPHSIHASPTKISIWSTSKNSTLPTSRSIPQATKSATTSKLQILHENKAQ